MVLMNQEQKNQVTKLRQEGYGYGKIARNLGLSKNIVSSWCRRTGLTGDTSKQDTSIPELCPVCGIVIIQTPGKRHKRFCSDKCRLAWWNSHPEKIHRKAFYSYTCSYCHKPFIAYGNCHRKYCSHACYIADRFGSGDGHE